MWERAVTRGVLAMVLVASSCTDPAAPGAPVPDGVGTFGGTMSGGATGGASASGSTAATSGSGVTGGTVGAPDGTGGTIGQSTGGTIGQSTGGMAGEEGVGGSDAGGAGGGTGTSTATGGSSGAGGDDGGGPVTLEELVGALDGQLIITPCRDTPNTDDCGSCYIVDGVVTGCRSGRMEVVLDHPIGGEPGAMYAVTMRFYGVMEPKIYGPEAEREAGDARPINETLPVDPAPGAEPAPWAVGKPGMEIRESGYGTYEIHVLDQNMQEVGLYFLNSDTAEGHYTYAIDYERTIPVVGGGVVRLRRYDSNCRVIKNCGATPGYPCAQKARILDLSAADPPPPEYEDPLRVDFQQPSTSGGANHGGQWWFIDVTAFEPIAGVD